MLPLAVVICDDVEANREQVVRGMAWVYTQYNKDLSLRQLEEIARVKQLGLWLDKQPMPPWEWRKNKREHKKKRMLGEEHSLEALRAFFAPDMGNRIIDSTPVFEFLDHSYVRQAEIMAWLRDQNRESEPWIALDDSDWLFAPECSI